MGFLPFVMQNLGRDAPRLLSQVSLGVLVNLTLYYGAPLKALADYPRARSNPSPCDKLSLALGFFFSLPPWGFVGLAAIWSIDFITEDFSRAVRFAKKKHVRVGKGARNERMELVAHATSTTFRFYLKPKSQKSCQMAAVHLVEMKIPDFMLIRFQVPLNLQLMGLCLKTAICFG